jgi:hypothetical protein
MPWLPELFTAPVMQQILDKRRLDALVAVPYFDGLILGDPDPLVESFAHEPEVHDPLRGRIKGVAAFRAFVTETSAWLHEHRASVEDVEHVILDGRGSEEVVLHLTTDAGNVSLPVALVADREPDGRIDELRVYFTSQPLTGRRTSRPPLLQPDPELPLSAAVAAYLHASAATDVATVVAAFESDGYVREALGSRRVHRGPDDLAAFYSAQFSAYGNIALHPCALVDDGRECVLEYNTGQAGTPPQAGAIAFTHGPSGKLAAVRLYDDLGPPSAPEA